MIKAPKLYFCDVGLAARLMGIHEPEQVSFHAQRGALFETFVVTEFLKGRFNKGLPSNLFFWRDSKGLEIDLILEDGEDLHPVDIKTGQTIVPDFFKALNNWVALSGQTEMPAWLVYGGDRELSNRNISIVPWMQISKLRMSNTL